MRPTDGPDPLRRVIHGLYRRLMRIFAPRELREGFGTEMDATFRARLASARGWGGCLSLLWTEVLQLPRLAFESLGARTWAGSADSLGVDGRQALRALRRDPVLLVLGVSVLSVGLGASTTALSAGRDILLRPLAVGHPEGVVDVLAERPGGNSFLGFSRLDIVAFRSEPTNLDDLAAYSGFRSVLDEAPGAEVRGSLVSENYFDLLEVGPHLGRTRLEEARGFAGAAVAVVSHDFWTARLGSRPDVVGSSIDLGGRTLEIVGVAAPRFTGTFTGFPVAVWVPWGMAPTYRTGFDPDDPGDRSWSAMGRLSAGATPEAAAAGLNRVADLLEARFPEANRGLSVRVVPTTGIDHSLRRSVASFLALISGFAVLVLVVACVNLSGLLVVRTLERQHEVAIRVALGARSARVLLGMLTQVVVITLLGAAGGFLVAGEAVTWLSGYLRAQWGGLSVDLDADALLLVVSSCVALVVLTASVTGPTLRLLRAGTAVLRTGSSVSPRRAWARSGIVLGQLALSVVLVTTAGVFARAASSGASADPGFDADRTLLFPVSVDAEGYSDDEAWELQRELVRTLRAAREVDAVSLALGPPLGVTRSPALIAIEGIQPPAGQPGHTVDVSYVGAGFHEAMGVPIEAGRGFEERDELEPRQTAIVSAAFASRFWPGREVLGRTLIVESVAATVVGVAEDMRYMVQDDSPDPLVYLSLAGRGLRASHVVVRSSGSVDAARMAVEAAIGRVGAGIRAQPRTGREILIEATVPQRLGTILVGVMGIVTAALAAISLYGVLQRHVGSRIRDLGIRLALGGRRRGIVVRIVGRGLALVLAGAAVALPATYVVARRLSSLVVGAEVELAPVFAAVVLGFSAMAVAATLPAALRAARVPPADTLRA